MPLEPRASWFSPKCVEAQQLTRHLGVKHCFGAGRESGTKSRQTLNTRYDLKITRVKELGKIAPVTSGEGVPPHKGGRSDQARATVYQKHRSPQSRKTMYGG
ncbi:hypothetical protein VNO80_31219 [Phaseolus coccineus]|uniref:Uncharacterized protein n=1 Tax=Phaseolus coccineus TaxID=3886 RepID=A0AAN9L960_PHACN